MPGFGVHIFKEICYGLKVFFSLGDLSAILYFMVRYW